MALNYISASGPHLGIQQMTSASSDTEKVENLIESTKAGTEPLRQSQRHLAAAMPHHHIPGPGTQFVQVARAGEVTTHRG